MLGFVPVYDSLKIFWTRIGGGGQVALQIRY